MKVEMNHSRTPCMRCQGPLSEVFAYSLELFFSIFFWYFFEIFITFLKLVIFRKNEYSQIIKLDVKFVPYHIGNTWAKQKSNYGARITFCMGKYDFTRKTCIFQSLNLTWENISPKRIFILVWCDAFEYLDKNGCIFLWYYSVKLNFRKRKYNFFPKKVTFLKFDSSLGENFSQGYFDFIPGFTVSL